MPYDPNKFYTVTYTDSQSQTSKKDNFYFPYYFSDINKAHGIPPYSECSATITTTMNRSKPASGTAIGQFGFGAGNGTSWPSSDNILWSRSGIDWDTNPPYTLTVDAVGWDDGGDTYDLIEFANDYFEEKYDHLLSEEYKSKNSIYEQLDK